MTVEKQNIIPITPVAEVEQSLLAVKQTIYPRAVSGWFANWRIALVLFTCEQMFPAASPVFSPRSKSAGAFAARPASAR